MQVAEPDRNSPGIRPPTPPTETPRRRPYRADGDGFGAATRPAAARQATFGDQPSEPDPACRGTARGTSHGELAVHCVLSGHLRVPSVQAARSGRRSSLLLIRGFGVQVPGGAPVLTWSFTRSGSPREGRFWAMFAPRLLVSPDLVPRADLVSLAPARSARPVCCPSPQHPLQSGPTDDITHFRAVRVRQPKGQRHIAAV
jgi:hypothetical protein